MEGRLISSGEMKNSSSFYPAAAARRRPPQDSLSDPESFISFPSVASRITSLAPPVAGRPVHHFNKRSRWGSVTLPGD